MADLARSLREGIGSVDLAGGQLQRFEFSSADEDEVDEFIRQQYVGKQTRFLAVPEDARFSAASVTGGGVSADRVTSAIDYFSTRVPYEHFFFLGVRSGRAHIAWGNEEVVVGAGEHLVYPLGVEMSLAVHDVDVRALRFPVAQVGDLAGEIVERADRFTFHPAAPISAQAARVWDAVMGLANEQMLAEDSVIGYPLLYAELLRTVAMTALHTFPNSLMLRDRVARRSQPAPASVRAAMAFIEDNAHLPLSLSDIAAAAGTTGRALQYGFARHHDTTPMLYLRRVRVEHAHRELRHSDPTSGATVVDIARRWGFANPSRFAAYYRAAYRQAPSQTLHS